MTTIPYSAAHAIHVADAQSDDLYQSSLDWWAAELVVMRARSDGVPDILRDSYYLRGQGNARTLFARTAPLGGSTPGGSDKHPRIVPIDFDEALGIAHAALDDENEERRLLGITDTELWDTINAI